LNHAAACYVSVISHSRPSALRASEVARSDPTTKEASTIMHRPSRRASLILGVLATASVLGATAAVAGGTSTDLLKAPMQGSVLSDPPLFGATRGGAPWVISSGEAKLESDGTVKVSLVGLLIPGVGVGPVRTVSATVACNGMLSATTPTVPFSATGDAQIKARVNLPDRCLAPAVLINPNGNTAVYIAATGR
jgi:hypothetical protein